MHYRRVRDVCIASQSEAKTCARELLFHSKQRIMKSDHSDGTGALKSGL